ncbi:multi-sensor hybrid histidine kinase [Candidatus Vecturithrix granuli]|uniref:histidine kinase n=1 Tax=Vecturithrix granuli TaxID=1499967 RepID=A0A081C7S5_VECG1|nr:multi-sensor hybrid histidine kinase [Candidatus Vecturithrix granuli]
MPARQRTGIFRKTFLLAFLLMVVIILFFATLTIPRQRKTILKSMEAQANAISSSIAQVCADAIATQDYPFLVEHNLKMLQGNPSILYVIVAYQNGFSLVLTQNRWEQRETLDARWEIETTEVVAGKILYSDLVRQKVFHYAFPLRYSFVSWGHLYLGLSLHDFNNAITSMYVIMLLLSLACLFIGVFGAYLFAKTLTHPILALREATNQLARGDLTVRARIMTRDEIEELATAFNQMAENLEKTTVSKDFVRNILETMTESLVVTTATGRIRMVNQATLQLLGYTEAELLDQPLHLLFTGEDPLLKDAWIDNLGQYGDKYNHERMLRSKTGVAIPVLFSAAVMYRDDQVQGIVCVALDIRQRKIAEEQLQQAYQDLKETQGQLIQTAKLASIGELAAGVAHELNQPLMVIRTAIQFLTRSLQKQRIGLQEVIEHLEPVERNTKRMMNIIDHLRAFSRQSQTPFAAINVNQVLDDAFLMIGEQLRLRNITVVKHFTPDLPTVSGDANRLEQVFLNLITNSRDAITAAPHANGTLNITTRVSESQTHVEIVIQDTGGGIPSEYLDKIFDPFFTTKEVGQGTGLGLSISYGIIKEHQGEIQVMETGSEGTTFVIRLPVESD